ncbi:hypothetical protein E2C01_014371 [Portunus trituberculatus]|uniref:Uncharacterized protein n=1 Tax=Portunus trituberculatus TaxID=210409 RepID=A0A5B7DJU0_PORTR|nr:hypothetical protein [Portunus trituberculatus]
MVRKQGVSEYGHKGEEGLPAPDLPSTARSKMGFSVMAFTSLPRSGKRPVPAPPPPSRFCCATPNPEEQRHISYTETLFPTPYTLACVDASATNPQGVGRHGGVEETVASVGAKISANIRRAKVTEWHGASWLLLVVVLPKETGVAKWCAAGCRKDQDLNTTGNQDLPRDPHLLNVEAEKSPVPLFCCWFPKRPPPVDALGVVPKGVTAEVVPNPVPSGCVIPAGLLLKSPPPVLGVERKPDVPGLFCVPKSPPVFCWPGRGGGKIRLSCVGLTCCCVFCPNWKPCMAKDGCCGCCAVVPNREGVVVAVLPKLNPVALGCCCCCVWPKEKPVLVVLGWPNPGVTLLAPNRLPPLVVPKPAVGW